MAVYLGSSTASPTITWRYTYSSTANSTTITFPSPPEPGPKDSPPTQKGSGMALTRVVVDFVGDLTENEQEKLAESVRSYAAGVLTDTFEIEDVPRSIAHPHKSTRNEACEFCYEHATDRQPKKSDG